jgi:hypothetical protein
MPRAAQSDGFGMSAGAEWAGSIIADAELILAVLALDYVGY